MAVTPKRTPASVRERLLKAALECFLADEYHAVTTRMIAERADANPSMIRYYFGNKEGLYEEMIRERWKPWLDVLDSPMWSSVSGFAEYLRLYYVSPVFKQTEFPKLILKVLALNQGPGRNVFLQLLERGREQCIRIVTALEKHGQIAPSTNHDFLWVAFVSLTIVPALFKEIFEEQMGRTMDAAFLENLANFNGHLFTAGLATATNEAVSKDIV